MLAGILRGRWSLRGGKPRRTQALRTHANMEFDGPPHSKAMLARRQPCSSQHRSQAAAWHMQRAQRSHLQSMFQPTKTGDSHCCKASSVTTVPLSATTTHIAPQADLAEETQVEVVLHVDGADDGAVFKIVGASHAMGSWKPEDGVLLRERAPGCWVGHVVLPSGSHAFKAVRLRGSSAEWEQGADRCIEVTTEQNYKPRQMLSVTCRWNEATPNRMQVAHKLEAVSGDTSWPGSEDYYAAAIHDEGEPVLPEGTKQTKEAVQDELARANAHLASLSQMQQMLQRRMQKLWEMTKEQEELYDTLLARMPSDMFATSSVAAIDTPSQRSLKRAPQGPAPVSPEIKPSSSCTAFQGSSNLQHPPSKVPNVTTLKHDAVSEAHNNTTVAALKQGSSRVGWSQSPAAPLSPWPPVDTSTSYPTAHPTPTTSYSITSRFPGLYPSSPAHSPITVLDPIVFSFSDRTRVQGGQTPPTASVQEEVADSEGRQQLPQELTRVDGTQHHQRELQENAHESVEPSLPAEGWETPDFLQCNRWWMDNQLHYAIEELPPVVYKFETQDMLTKGAAMQGKDIIVELDSLLHRDKQLPDAGQGTSDSSDLSADASPAQLTEGMLHESRNIAGRLMNTAFSGVAGDALWSSSNEREQPMELEPITFSFLPDGSVTITATAAHDAADLDEGTATPEEVDANITGLVPDSGTVSTFDWSALDLNVKEGLLDIVPATTYTHNVFQSYQEESERNPWYMLPVGASQDELPASPAPSSPHLNPQHMAVKVAEAVLHSDSDSCGASAYSSDQQQYPDLPLNIDSFLTASSVGSATAMLTGLLLVNAPDMSSMNLAAGRTSGGDPADIFAQDRHAGEEVPGARAGLRQVPELMNTAVASDVEEPLKAVDAGVLDIAAEELVEMTQPSSQDMQEYQIAVSEPTSCLDTDQVKGDTVFELVNDDAISDESTGNIANDKFVPAVSAAAGMLEQAEENDVFNASSDLATGPARVQDQNAFAEVSTAVNLPVLLEVDDAATQSSAGMNLMDPAAMASKALEEFGLQEWSELDVPLVEDSKKSDGGAAAFDFDGVDVFMDEPFESSTDDWMAAFDINGSNPFREQPPLAATAALPGAVGVEDSDFILEEAEDESIGAQLEEDVFASEQYGKNDEFVFRQMPGVQAGLPALRHGSPISSATACPTPSFTMAAEMMQLQQSAVLKGTADTVSTLRPMLYHSLPCESSLQQVLPSDSNTSAAFGTDAAGLVADAADPINTHQSGLMVEVADAADPSPDNQTLSGPAPAAGPVAPTVSKSPGGVVYSPAGAMLHAWLNDLAAAAQVVEPDFVYSASLTDEDVIAEKLQDSLTPAAAEESFLIDLDRYVYRADGNQQSEVYFGDDGQLLQQTSTVLDAEAVALDVDIASAGENTPGPASWQLATIVLELQAEAGVTAYVDGFPPQSLTRPAASSGVGVLSAQQDLLQRDVQSFELDLALSDTDSESGSGEIRRETVNGISDSLSTVILPLASQDSAQNKISVGDVGLDTNIASSEQSLEAQESTAAHGVSGSLHKLSSTWVDAKARVASEWRDMEGGLRAEWTDTLAQLNSSLQECKENLRTVRSEMSVQLDTSKSELAAQVSCSLSNASAELQDLQDKINVLQSDMALDVEDAAGQWHREWERVQARASSELTQNRITVDAQVVDMQQKMSEAVTGLLQQAQQTRASLTQQMEDIYAQLQVGKSAAELGDTPVTWRQVMEHLQQGVERNAREASFQFPKDVLKDAGDGMSGAQAQILEKVDEVLRGLEAQRKSVESAQAQLARQLRDAQASFVGEMDDTRRAWGETGVQLCERLFDAQASTMAKMDDVQKSLSSMKQQLSERMGDVETGLHAAQEQLTAQLDTVQRQAADVKEELQETWEEKKRVLGEEVQNVSRELGDRGVTLIQWGAQLGESQAKMKAMFDCWLVEQVQVKSWAAPNWLVETTREPLERESSLSGTDMFSSVLKRPMMREEADTRSLGTEGNGPFNVGHDGQNDVGDHGTCNDVPSGADVDVGSREIHEQQQLLNEWNEVELQYQANSQASATSAAASAAESSSAVDVVQQRSQGLDVSTVSTADAAGEVDVSALSDAQLAQLEAVLESTACFAAFYQLMKVEQQDAASRRDPLGVLSMVSQD